MKFCVLLFSLLFVSVVPEIASVRKAYIDAAISQNDAQAFHKDFQAFDENHKNGTLVAYKAASIVLMAKYESGIFSKMKYFNKGKDLLESVIRKDPENYEARLIRFNIQDNVPWITGYTSNIKEDKAFLIKNFSQQPEDLKAFTKKYVLQCDAFSNAEKAVFNTN